jgi:Protein of unknown function (DUF2950)
MREKTFIQSVAHQHTFGSWCRPLLVGLFLCTLALGLHGEAAGANPSSQKTFGTPQEAADTLVQAAASYDVPALLEILGPESKDFISSADPTRDKQLASDFAGKAREKTDVVIDKTATRAVVSIGTDAWPFPVPIVKKDGRWRFDSVQGRDEILLRRIGSNELDAIQICRGFVEAQHEYASDIHDDTGINQFAQNIRSTPGKHDGLYWENSDGTPGGPISEAIARAIGEGYSPGQTSGYHGYYFRVLKGQGLHAPLGKLDYVIEGVMIGGFALVAFPAQYRVTGVKTFLVSYDGVVYEKDLGPDTLTIGQSMERYDPDKSWHSTNDEWPADAIASSE